jgi:uncharacterized protein involved in exopolysaccharide biosynthesis
MNDYGLAIQEITALMWRRRTLIGVVFGAGLLTVIVMAWLQGPTYRASAKMMVTSARATITVSPDANERPRVDPVTDADLSSEVAMLNSGSMLREVLAPYRERQKEAQQPPSGFARVMDVLTYPLSLPSRIYRAIHELPPSSGLEEWVAETQQHLTVTQLGRSSLIEVAFENRNPQWAADLVNNLVSHHVERHVQMNQQNSAQQFYESQRTLLTETLRTAENKLREFYERESIDSATKGLTDLRTRVSQLETSLADAEVELAESAAEAEFLNHAMTTLPRGGGEPVGNLTTGTTLIKNRIVELELQRSQLLTQYAPTSMKIEDLDRQIKEAHRLLDEEKMLATGPGDPARAKLEANRTQSQARAAALQARTASLRTQLDSSRVQLAHMDAISSDQEHLEQDVNNSKASLATYLKKEEEARFSNALDESRIVNVSIVDRATPPQSPMQSKRTLTILIGAIMSLAAGLLLAFLRDWFDPTVKGGADAQRISGLPVLAEIPY